MGGGGGSKYGSESKNEMILIKWETEEIMNFFSYGDRKVEQFKPNVLFLFGPFPKITRYKIY